MYALYINYSDPGAQVAELLTSQGFGQYVRQLICSSNRLGLHPAILNTLSDEVIPDINVFVAVVEHRILAERDGGLVVNLQAGGTGLSASEF